jgi:lactate permease
MVGMRWSAASAGVAALAVGVPLSLLAFGFAPTGLLGVAAEGLFMASTILWILLPALALHLHQDRIGSLDTVRTALARLTSERPMQALLIGWFVALFFEGAAGFGTPIAIAAPMLVGLGFRPIDAVVLALLGHASGVVFGALGTPVAAQVAITAADPLSIAQPTAWLAASLCVVSMALFTLALRQALDGPLGGGVVGAAVLAMVAFAVPFVVLASALGPELPTLGGALLGGAVFVAWLRWRSRAAPGQQALDVKPLRRAAWPYLVLVALVLLTRVPGVDRWTMAAWHWRWMDEFGGRIAPLSHPGTLLMAALLLGTALQGSPSRDAAVALRGSARRLLPVAVALLAVLCLSRLMLHAGMVLALQQVAVEQLGSLWPWFAPAIGALGSFVTGSATASNVLLTGLQTQTAGALSLPASAMAAAQGVGAGIGNIVCPHNVVAGAATVGLAGREGEVLRRTAPACLVYLVLAGLAVQGLLWWTT